MKIKQSMLAVAILLLTQLTAYATVIRDGQAVYIVDRTGERWDITQAVSLGFQSEGFQFGIGRYAITPLDDRHIRVVESNASGAPKDTRVIGINQDSQAHAYTVSRLTRHEIANTTIGSSPIAAAY